MTFITNRETITANIIGGDWACMGRWICGVQGECDLAKPKSPLILITKKVRISVLKSVLGGDVSEAVHIHESIYVWGSPNFFPMAVFEGKKNITC